MNRTEWLVIGFTFLLLGMYFIYTDNGFGEICGVPGTIGYEEGNDPLTRLELWCINTEIYDPFIWMFNILFFACMINAYIAERNK